MAWHGPDGYSWLMITTHVFRQMRTLGRQAPGSAIAPALPSPRRPAPGRRPPGDVPGFALAARRSRLANPPAPAGRSIAFTDPEAYERMTGAWSRRVGEAFLDWLAPQPAGRWLDAGCGNGAFTRLIVERCAPVSVDGIDPEPSQVEFARRRSDAEGVRFQQGDALALPFSGASFDVGVMALVLAFLPDPARGLSEMIRVLAPGGTACAYNWDLAGGGSPLAPLGLAMRQAGVPADVACSEEVSCEAATRRLWVDAGLQDVRTRRITVHRHFDSLEQAWEVSSLGASVAGVLSGLNERKRAEVKARFAENLRQDTRGVITLTAAAVAVRGVVRR
jgi:SAM-dependent methyltransferase